VLYLQSDFFAVGYLTFRVTRWDDFSPSGRYFFLGEPLWLSGKVVKNEKINEIERTRVCSPPRATF
jgi:hypothetical protein